MRLKRFRLWSLGCARLAGSRVTMQCKACSTRIDPGHSVCPNCGRTTGHTLSARPAASPKKAKQGAQGKSNAPRKAAVASKATIQSKAAAAKPAATKQSEERTEVPTEVTDEPNAIDLELEDIAGVLVEYSSEESHEVMEPSQGLGAKPSELRAILAENPELLETDLSVLAGKPRGVCYPTDVGEIDLLLVDDAGDLVVVSIPDIDSQADAVTEVLQRIGWVRKHVAEGKSSVRGIVLLPPMPEDLSYAAAAVMGTVAFRTYRMSVSFEDLEF